VGGAAVVLGGDMLFRPQFNSGNLLALTSSFLWRNISLLPARTRTFLRLKYVFLITATCCAALFVYNLQPATPQRLRCANLVGLSSRRIGFTGRRLLLNRLRVGQLPAALVSPSMIAQPY
jgi:hypothetical protein